MSLRTSLRRRLAGESPGGPRPAPARVAEPGGDRVWPYWLERQLDPHSPALVPAEGTDGSAGPANVTARNWTAIGNLDSPLAATVDPRGLVTPVPGGWSLDWWVGADDRWHVPSREVGVRQRLVDGAPVVETAMRIPSGDAVAQAYAVRRSSAEGGGEVVVVDFANRSPVPVALALAVRPYGPEALAHVERIEVDGTVVTVDGRVALLLSRLPARYATASQGAGDGDGPADVAATVLAGEAGTHWPGTVTSAEGDAQAAFVFPLAHGATLQVALPLTSPGEEPRRSFPSAVPGAEHVARGWRSQADRGVRLELPDARLAEAVAANRRFLLLRHDDPVGPPAGGSPVRQVAGLAAALDAHGYHDEAVRVLAPLPDRQRPDGGFPDEPDERAAVGAALWALGQHWRLAREPVVAKLAADTVVAGAHRLERARRSARAADAPWVAAGLAAAADVLLAAGEPAAAEAVGEVAAEAAVGLVPALLTVPAAAGVSAGEATGAGGRAVAEPGEGGLRPDRTLLLATAELRSGDERALARLAWVLETASPTWTWPSVVHPRLGGGAAGDGHDLATAVALLGFVRDLLVREDGAGGLALSSLVPEAWLGQGWEVHDAPTAAGRLSYAVRWHGDRPAILWDLDRHPGTGPVRLTAPGLDPTWSTTEARGEALLAPVAGSFVQPAPRPAAEPAAPPAPGPPSGTGPSGGTTPPVQDPPDDMAPPAPIDPGSLS
ncbi:MAG TPA: hypothetical protein VKA65_04850 [Acidimicrobiales bacterium]|nr:hypothetical protein [Acidimicrobiales bacterium]